MSTNIQSTLTQLQNDTNQINFQNGQKNLGSSQLDPNAFMELLMAQLQNQDPTNPTDSSNFLTQQAQLANVQQMQTLTNVLQNNSAIAQGSSVVGKQVDVTVPGSTAIGLNTPAQTVTGVVQSVSLNSSTGTASVNINGQSYNLNQITKIYGS